MAAVSLLTTDDRTFIFEHAMAHRGLLGGLAPLDRFSATTYLMDPIEGVDQPASPWHLNHQLLHDDFTNALPPGVASEQILVDTDLSNQRQRIWWEFANHQMHFFANQISPPQSIYPYW